MIVCVVLVIVCVVLVIMCLVLVSCVYSFSKCALLGVGLNGD